MHGRIFVFCCCRVKWPTYLHFTHFTQKVFFSTKKQLLFASLHFHRRTKIRQSCGRLKLVNQSINFLVKSESLTPYKFSIKRQTVFCQFYEANVHQYPEKLFISSKYVVLHLSPKLRLPLLMRSSGYQLMYFTIFSQDHPQRSCRFLLVWQIQVQERILLVGIQIILKNFRLPHAIAMSCP